MQLHNLNFKSWKLSNAGAARVRLNIKTILQLIDIKKKEAISCGLEYVALVYQTRENDYYLAFLTAKKSTFSAVERVYINY